MLKVSELKGYPIICLDTNKIEGEVRDVILDLDKRIITDLIIEYGNLLHKTKLLYYRSIYSINNDAITTKFKKNLREIRNCNRKLIKKRKQIIGMEVINKKGDILGFIKDVLFKENDGSILGLILTNGIIDDMLKGVEVIPMDENICFNSDRIIINENIEAAILNNIGGLKKLLELER